MMIGPIQRSLCSVKGRDQCYMPAPHLAPFVIKAQAVLVLWYLCLMELRNSGGTYPW